MKAKIALLITVIVMLAAGGYIFLDRNKESPNPPAEMAAPLAKNNSRYVEYSKTALDSAKEKRRVLFFYASWCPICRPADTSFKENIDKIPEDVVVIRVNFNDPDTDSEEKELARKYAVTYQHTFVQIDPDGNEITKWNGGEIDELLERLKFNEVLASFAIFTNGTFRVFTAPMYHNLSQDSYIQATNPNVIHVKKAGVTWNQFFETLPFKLTQDCLTTGTKETFCTGDGGTLKFYLNGSVDEAALNKQIKSGDKLLVSFGSGNDQQIQAQLQQIP